MKQSFRFRIPIAREGYPFILTPWVIALLVLGFGFPFSACFPAVIGVFCLWFFRDPERIIPKVPGAVTSPADGKIVEIVREKENLVRISIFMSVFNVHVNRFPLPGKVVETVHKPGKFRIASGHGAGSENERLITSAHMENGALFLVVQVAGFVARRIVSRAHPGDRFDKGERFGMIRFGSRVDLHIPANVRIVLGAGDKVIAGESILGYLDGEK